MEKLKERIDKTKTYTQSEYARMRGVSPQVVYYWVRTGKIKTIKVRGTTLILG